MKQEEVNKATAWKRVSENKQRADEKDRNEAWSKASGKSKPESDIEAGWKPVWFKADKDHTGETYWVIDRWYWDEHKKCLDAGKTPMVELKADWYSLVVLLC